MSGSSFRDTFTKEQVKEPLLSYDTAAFLFFFAAVLCSILLPLVHFHIILPSFRFIFKRSNSNCTDDATISCQCGLCTSTKTKRQGIQAHLTWSRILIVIVGTMLFITCMKLRGLTLEIKSFDPFAILEIDPSQYPAPEGIPKSVVKKQYRMLSLRYHPDKNNNDPASVAHFLLINKAHQSLTDEVAKRNYEQYGNPDGPTSMKVGIGLPKFLIMEEYQILILCLFFVTLLVIIPMALMHIYRNQVRLSGTFGGASRETLNFLAYSLNNTKRYRYMIELIAASEEARSVPGLDVISPEENEELTNLIKDYPDVKKKTFKVQSVTRNFFLLNAHIFRKHHQMNCQQKALLNGILRPSLGITQSIYELCLVRDWIQAAESALELRRSIIQACDGKNCFMLQIPHMNDNIAKNIKSRKPIKNMKDFILAWNAATKPIEGLTPEQTQDIDKFVTVIPILETPQIHVFVEDEDAMAMGDIATMTIATVRTNMTKNQQLERGHSPFFPLQKREEWIILVTDKDSGSILQWSRFRGSQQTIGARLKFMLNKPGNQTLRVQIWNDMYFGVDIEAEHQINVIGKNQVKRQVYVHPEDLELDNNPTLYQQMMSNQMDDEGSSGAEEVFEVDVITGQLRLAEIVSSTKSSNAKKT